MRRTAAFVALLAAGSRAAAAQIRASEPALVSQTIDGAAITIEYYRPMAKGRTLFGERGVVKWGEVWTPGANWATTLEAGRDVHIDGQRLPKGKYSVWLVPRDTGEWTLVLDARARRYHTNRPRPDSAVLRVGVRPEVGPFMEGLIWYFPAVTRGGATLRLHWGTTVVPLALRVDPESPTPVAAEERRVYAGTYRYYGTLDTTSRTLEIVETPEGGIRGRGAPYLFRDFDRDVELRPLGDRRFAIGVSRQGAPVDGRWVDLVFTVVNGRATGFDMVLDGPGARSFGRGERLP
jgi:hypothetical protein